MRKKILFRADGNAVIGAGHIMRCLSIGIAARNLGVECCYVTSDEAFLDVLEKNEFRVEVMHSRYTEMNDEISIFEKIILRESPDIIVVDSYFVTPGYLKKIKLYTKLAYIDDVMSFAYPVDVLINYNIYGRQTDYKKLYDKENLPQLLLGSSFTPLREEFQSGEMIKINQSIKNILFSAGGADPERMALRFAEKIVNERECKDIKFHIIMGNFEPDKEKLEKIALCHNNVCLHSNIKKMSSLMRQCDLAVSAAGSTLYELCACGVPTITYVLEDNQLYGANAFEQKGIMINAGDDRYNPNLINDIFKEIKILASDSNKRIMMQNYMKKCIDGKGAKRIIKELLE